jgi:eukaryotic-like serine/threonine-protein kinase
MDNTRRMNPRAPVRARGLEPGDRVADWVVVRALASGGFGAVYEARHATSGLVAALKVLHAHLVTSAETLARFDREIHIVKTLHHPSVVQLLDAGFSADGRPYLCMELLNGEELTGVIEHEGQLPLPRALQILESICNAAWTAHQANIIHRDIKSQNIMLCRDGRVVLLDFGIAKISDALAPELTATNQSLGTPSCMAPEQIKGTRPDPRTDVYALGGLLFHMVCGRKPFMDPSPTMTQYLHLHAKRPRASQVKKGVPEQIDEVIVRAMAIEPSDRFPDARSFLAAALTAGRDRRAVTTTLLDAVALLITVKDMTGGSTYDAALFDDLEGVLPAAERFLSQRGFSLAIDLGASAIFIAPAESVEAPTTLALEVFAHLAAREGKDPRVQVGICVHRDEATVIGNEIQPADLLRPSTWPAPDPLEGVWVTAVIEPPLGGRVH